MISKRSLIYVWILVINSKNASSYNTTDALNEIKHRGPDSLGSFISNNNDCFLGHVRLSIIDVSRSW